MVIETQRLHAVSVLMLVTLLVHAHHTSAQCQSGDVSIEPGVVGGGNYDHFFFNSCLAASATDVTITIEAMADLGCHIFDANNDPPTGEECPDGCTPLAVIPRQRISISP